MPCPSAEYGSGRDDDRHWHNWLGNISYRVPSYFQPASRPDLVWILQQAEAQGKRVKAVGSGWSFEDCAVSEDWVVDISLLDRTITFLTHPATGPTYLTPAWTARQFRASTEKLYHVEAGISIFKLNRRLQSEGLAMLTLGGSQGQTLAGAISTSTHGSDLDQPPLPGVIQAIHLVTTGGFELWIESASDPITANDGALLATLLCRDLRIIRDDELLRAAMVTVGRFGVVYSYVIKVTGFFRLSEWTETLNWSSVSGALRAGTGLGSNVAVRGHLGGLPGLLSDPPAGLEIATPAGNFRFLDILINSNLKRRPGDDLCWVRRRWLTNNTSLLNLTASGNFLCYPGVANAVLVAAGAALGAYAAQVAAIPFYGAVKAAQIGIDAARLNAMAHDPGIKGGDALAESLNAVWKAQIGHDLEWLIAELNQIILRKGLGKSRGDGRRGPGWQISSGLVERADDECYRANSIELIYGAETPAYIDFIDRLLDNAHKFNVGGYIAVRFSSRCDAFLSMHNVNGPLAVSIEVASIYGIEGNAGWIEFAEQTAKELGGRPHWGQQNRLTTLDVLNLYRFQDLESWRHQCYLAVGSTSKTFSNNYTRQRGLEPLQRQATAFAMVSPAVLNLGRVLKDTAISRDRSLTIANVGTGSLAVQSVRVVGAQAAAFSVSPHPPGPLPVTLQQGAAFPLSIRFQGASIGEHQARVQFHVVEHRSGSQMVVEAYLQAHVVAPDMDVLPRVVSFGVVTTGQEVLRNVLVANTGSAPLRFRVAPPTLGSYFQWAGDAPFHWRSLEPGESEAIRVRFQPAVTGVHESQLVLISETETVTVRLWGERLPAAQPQIHAIPRRVSFGVVNVGTPETVQVVLANESGARLNIRAVRIEGPDSRLFALPGPIPNMVQAGQTALLAVRFSPERSVVGGHQATLVIESDAGNEPRLEVDLFGVGAGSHPGGQWLEAALGVMMR